MKLYYGIHLFFSLISIMILISVYQYLERLKTCSCFIEKQNPNYKVNVAFLQFYQVLEIFALFIFICFMALYKNKLFKTSNLKNKLGMRFFTLFSGIIFLVISGYVSYNSFLLFLMAKKDCECLQDWQKYIVYVQGIFNSIYFLRILLWIVLIFIFLLFKFAK